jgi:hypothetical protein
MMVVLSGVSEEKVRSILGKVRVSVLSLVSTSNREAPRTAREDQNEKRQGCMDDIPMKPREWAARKGSDVGSDMIGRCCG